MALAIPAGMAAAGAGTAAAASGATVAGLSAGTWATIASTAFTVGMQHRQGKIQEAQYKAQAEQEKVAAKEREISRRRRLVAALSSQNAAAGARGITPSGSFDAVQREDMRLADFDSLQDQANTGQRVGINQLQAKAARSNARMRSGATLLDAADRYYSRG